MVGKFIKAAGAGSALGAAIVLATGVAASAHECYVPNRSEQGNAKAGANSKAWYTLVVQDAINGGVGAPEEGGITQEQADCVYSAYLAGGGPATFTVHVKGATGQGGTIGANNPNIEKASDGKGVDRIFAAYGSVIIGAYGACGVDF